VTRRIATTLIAAALALAACTSTPPAGEPSARTCEGGLGSCGVEVGPPGTFYCPTTAGACNGHPIRPDQIGGHLFAGVTATGHGRTD
jgi:hypothetical protein